MVNYDYLRPPISLTLPGQLFESLMGHLFPGDGDEHGAIVLAGISQGSKGTRLLARELFLARNGADYVTGKRGYKMLRATFISDIIAKCRDERLVYLATHNHGGRHYVSFSPDDMASHRRGYPALLDITKGMPVGALVFAEEAVAGDLWMPNGKRFKLDHAIIIGNKRKVIRSKGEFSNFKSDLRYDRQSRLFGDRGQEILQSLTVGVIGVGGVGALLIEFLARLGVGHLIVVDPDRIDSTNLPRLPGATNLDAFPWLTRPGTPAFFKKIGARVCTPKVVYAERIARRANPAIKVTRLFKDVLDSKVIDPFRDCDYVFLAADKMQVRLLFNALVHQYLIPGAQIGSKVETDKESGKVIDVFSVYRPVTLYSGCLWCNGLINPKKLQEESLTPDQLRSQRYIDDTTVVSPSVIGLNAIGVSLAINDFMFYATGLLETDIELDFQRYQPLSRSMMLEKPRRDEECPECGFTMRSRFAKGDTRSLPNRGY